MKLAHAVNARAPARSHVAGTHFAGTLLAGTLLAGVLLASAACTETHVNVTETLHYPAAPRGNVVDVLHGTSVPDPYRWLEDPDAPASRAWIDAENALTESFLAGVPARARIRERLRALWNYERFGLPRDEGGRTYFTRNDGLQQQAVLWVQDSPDAPPRVLLDPNTLSADGTVALSEYAPSPDGRLLAYSVSEAGSDWTEWRVRDVASGTDRADRIRRVKFSGVSWFPDGSAFTYSRYPEPAAGEEQQGQLFFQKLMLHRLGTPQADDELLYERPDEKEWGFGGSVTDDGRWLAISVWRGTEQKNAFYYRDLSVPGGAVKPLITAWDAAYHFLGNVGGTFFFRTDLDAPLGRVIAIDTAHPERSAWREVVPEGDDALQTASLVGGRVVCESLHHAVSRVRIFGTDGRHERDVDLPGAGSVGGFGGHADRTGTYFSYTDPKTPSEVWRYDVASGAASIFRRPTVDFRPEDFASEQVFVTSRDGTRVPMLLTWKKGTPRSPQTPCVLNGYGGFNISLTPNFSATSLVWMEMGGVLATANLRGGGEYGDAWHEAGTKERKQNVFDDFIACAEWLVREGRTSPPKLAISGGSNGGLLVGAGRTQRPDLFGACLPAVGVMDMLRYHKFTIGWAWASDYGTADDADEFRTLLAYSPLHNLKPGTSYPPTLVTTGDHDDRVVPAHSFKFAAALQHVQTGPNPCLIRIETRAGHGAGKPTSKVIEEAADRWAFLVRVLGME